MSKLTKTVGKLKLWSIIGGALIIVGIVLAAVFGFNTDAMASDNKTLTVKMNSYAYTAKLDEVKKLCEAELDAAGLGEAYTVMGEMSGGSDEIVYVFSAGTDETKLREAGDKLQTKFDAAVNDSGNALEGAEFQTFVGSDKATATLAEGFYWRAIVAACVILVIEFVYVSVRYKLVMGVATSAASLAALLLTVALAAIVRLPVTASLAYVAALAMLYAAFAALAAFNKMRENFKTDEFKSMSAEEAIANSMPYKTVLTFAAVAAISLMITGGVAFAAANVRWFAVAALIALASGTYSSVFFMPALFLPLKKISDKKAAIRARYDYKKGAKKETDKSGKTEAAEKAEEK